MKRFLICMLLVLAFVMGACSSVPASAEQELPLTYWFDTDGNTMKFYYLVDDETGVNYIVVRTNGPNGGKAPTITPRLNADGSLYVS